MEEAEGVSGVVVVEEVEEECLAEVAEKVEGTEETEGVHVEGEACLEGAEEDNAEGEACLGVEIEAEVVKGEAVARLVEDLTIVADKEEVNSMVGEEAGLLGAGTMAGEVNLMAMAVLEVAPTKVLAHKEEVV